MVFKPCRSASKKWRRLKPTSPTSDNSSQVDRNRPIVLYNEILLKQTGYRMGEIAVRTACSGRFFSVSPIAGGGCPLREFGALL